MKKGEGKQPGILVAVKVVGWDFTDKDNVKIGLQMDYCIHMPYIYSPLGDVHKDFVCSSK